MGSGSYTKVIYGHPNWKEFVGEDKIEEFELVFKEYEEKCSGSDFIEKPYNGGKFLGIELLSSLNDDFGFKPTKLSNLTNTILESINAEALKRAKKEWNSLKKILKKIDIDLPDGDLIWTGDYD